MHWIVRPASYVDNHSEPPCSMPVEAVSWQSVIRREKIEDGRSAS
jgi:hypothetical protein